MHLKKWEEDGVEFVTGKFMRAKLELSSGTERRAQAGLKDSKG